MIELLTPQEVADFEALTTSERDRRYLRTIRAAWTERDEARGIAMRTSENLFICKGDKLAAEGDCARLEAEVARLTAERDEWKHKAQEEFLAWHTQAFVGPEILKHERDSARRWAKAWKRAAVNWRYSWCGADGRAQRAWAQAQRTREKAEADLARLAAERDAALEVAKGRLIGTGLCLSTKTEYLSGRRAQADLAALRTRLERAGRVVSAAREYGAIIALPAQDDPALSRLHGATHNLRAALAEYDKEGEQA